MCTQRRRKKPFLFVSPLNFYSSVVKMHQTSSLIYAFALSLYKYIYMVCGALEGVNFEWSFNRTPVSSPKNEEKKSSNNSYACKPSRPKDAVCWYSCVFSAKCAGICWWLKVWKFWRAQHLCSSCVYFNHNEVMLYYIQRANYEMKKYWPKKSHWITNFETHKPQLQPKHLSQEKGICDVKSITTDRNCSVSKRLV